MSFKGSGLAVLLVFAAAMIFAAYTLRDLLFSLFGLLAIGVFVILVVVLGMNAGSAVFRFR